MTDALTALAARLGGSGSAVRGRTQARVMRAIAQQLGTGAQRDLAEMLGVSAGTVSKAVAQLKEIGLVKQDNPSLVQGPGRPLTPLSWTRNYAALGVTITDQDSRPCELIGTVIGLDGEPFPVLLEGVDLRYRLKEAARTDGSLFVKELEAFIRSLIDACRGDEAPELLGCGVTVGGHVDHGTIRLSYNTDWGAHPDSWAVADGLDLMAVLEERLGMTVVLDNDVTSLAVRANLRPNRYERPARSYALLAVLEDGIGGALVLPNGEAQVDSRTWRGASGMAGEPGHLPVRHVATITLGGAPASTAVDMPVCRCGRPGHVEAFAAPRAIRARAEAKNLVTQPTSIDELAARPHADEALSLLFKQGGVALGKAIVSAINWINPERVVVYLPDALHETNRYLAGSHYLAGLHGEIDENAFSTGKKTPLKLIPTSNALMEERRSAAAAYLVFDTLTDKVESAG